MANFVSQSQQYDAPAIEAKILDMEGELQDEVTIRANLDATTADKLESARTFITDNGDMIAAQLERMQTLDKQIREAVAENEKLEASDTEYQALVASEPFVAVADKIASLQALAVKLDDFLVQKGRRGRPPLN